MQTYGWDVITAVSFEDAAQELRLASAQFPNAVFEFNDPVARYTVVGALGAPWQICGGSGSRLVLRLPITGSVRPAGRPPAAFSGAVTIEVALGWAPSARPPGGQDLVFRFAPGITADDTAIAVTAVALDEFSAIGFQNLAPLERAVRQCLFANRAHFAHIVATIETAHAAVVINAEFNNGKGALTVLRATAERTPPPPEPPVAPPPRHWRHGVPAFLNPSWRVPPATDSA